MIKMIAACTSNSVIGLNGKIPFSYPADMRQFKALTLNSTVIMGRKTFEGIGKPLPKRLNIVISNSKIMVQKDVYTVSSIKAALELAEDNKDIWLIGGANIYQEGMKYAQEIHLTITPDEEKDPNSVKFPWIDPTVFKLDSWEYFADEPKLKYCIYKRI
jgi:dihydrofolate reductase